MLTRLRDIKNTSNDSTSSYETAWSSSFDKRNNGPALKESENLKQSDIEENAENDVSMLSNDISMMSVSSPKSPFVKKTSKNNSNYFTPKTKVSDITSKLLSSIKKDDERQLLMQCYPELFEHDEEPKQPKRPTRKIIKTELFDDDDDKENTPPKETRKIKVEPEIQESEDEKDDTFEKYLRKFRESSPKKVEKVPQTSAPITKFVIDDDEEENLSSGSGEQSESSFSSSEYEASFEIDNKKRAKKTKSTPTDDDEYFLESLDEKYAKPRHSSTLVFTKDGAMRKTKNREDLITKLGDIFRKRCFPEIPEGMLEITWNTRLRKSAGQCRNHSKGNSTIEMSTVVCTTAQRVRDTLVHEMCHAAVWIVDKLYKEGHGPGWKRWASKCMKTFKCLPLIERCHSYEIEAKFSYICVNEECKQTIKRQSKSLDIERKICGKCKSRFALYRFDRRTKKQVLVEKKNSDSNNIPKEEEKRKITIGNDFNEFVKENYWNYNKPGMKHAQVMKVLTEKYNSK